MSEDVKITVDGKPLAAKHGKSLAAVLLDSGVVRFRALVSGEPRAPLCGMGICFDCRVNVDAEQHVRACMVLVREGMDVRTGF